MTIRRPIAIGTKFGRLTVVEQIPTYCRCLCECGTQKMVQTTHLLTTMVKSCGCLYRDTRDTKGDHGHYVGGRRTSTARVWINMIQRCTKPNHQAYASYGGRGITVCARWMNFKNFLEDMGVRPDGMSLDRLDNNKGYQPDNCAWRTRKHQARNRRDTVRAILNGTLVSVADEAEARGLPIKMVARRVKKGMPLDLALSFPSQRANPQPTASGGGGN